MFEYRMVLTNLLGDTGLRMEILLYYNEYQTFLYFFLNFIYFLLLNEIFVCEIHETEKSDKQTSKNCTCMFIFYVYVLF